MTSPKELQGLAINSQAWFSKACELCHELMRYPLEGPGYRGAAVACTRVEENRRCIFRGDEEIWIVHETKARSIIHMTGCGEYRLRREPREGWSKLFIEYESARGHAESLGKEVWDCNRVLRKFGKPIHGD